MHISNRTIKFSAITLALFSYCGATLADAEKNTAEELDTITVTSQQDEISVKDKKVGETIKTSSQLKRQQVQDSRDLVRYETGVTVVEAGRFGSSGYAIRGVDENRVAITVDGLHQAETLSSQGFKELFEGYGNFNNTRNSVEIETLKQVSINKGASSVKTGSGALGGAVIFETKDARDLLVEKDWHVSYKKGYNTADRLNLDTVTLAGRYKWFDALIVKTKRQGHELKNFDYKSAADINTKRREKADPYEINKDSTLIKLAFSPTENHRISFAVDLYKNLVEGQDLSYSLQATRTQPDNPNSSTRHTHDFSKRKNYAVAYENYSSNPFWDTLKITYSDQKIKNKARTDDYCDADSCQGIYDPLANPLFSLKDGKIVDKQGNELNLKAVKKDDGTGDYIYSLVDKQGNPLPHNDKYAVQSAYFKLARLTDMYFDCDVFNCDSKIEYWDYPTTGYDNIALSRKEAEREIIEYNGKRYSRVKDATFSSTRGILYPNSAGFAPRNYHDRDLNTNTKQVNLDLTKQITLFKQFHELQYGASYSKTKKEMVNFSGADAFNPQWWAQGFLGVNFSGKPKTCEDLYVIKTNYQCPTVDGPYSFLIPVVTKTGALYFSDSFSVNPYLSFNLGYRYDRIKYRPEYIPGATPKIPDDMVKGVFIPLHKIDKFPKSLYSSEFNYGKDKQKYDTYIADYNLKKAENDKNAEKNIDYIAQNKKYKSHSYDIGINIDPSKNIRVQFKHAKGFRAPTSDELYFTFKHPDFSVLPNVNLKAETSKTDEVAFTYYGDAGYFTTSLFQTKYKNFIDLVYIGSKKLTNIHGGKARAEPFEIYQNINRQNAKVKGLELNGKVYLNSLWDKLDGLEASYKFTYQKGRMDGNLPINAIQPKTHVIGLGYHNKNGRFGLDLFVTHVSEKKAKDTYNMYWESQRDYEKETYRNRPDLQVTKDSTQRWRSNAYTLFDVIAYAKPIKNVTLQFGVYNLTNKKYLTWDSARSIRPFGTSNLIDQRTGAGINRFYSPGRNYKLSAEVTF